MTVAHTVASILRGKDKRSHNQGWVWQQWVRSQGREACGQKLTGSRNNALPTSDMQNSLLAYHWQYLKVDASRAVTEGTNCSKGEIKSRTHKAKPRNNLMFHGEIDVTSKAPVCPIPGQRLNFSRWLKSGLHASASGVSERLCQKQVLGCKFCLRL